MPKKHILSERMPNNQEPSGTFKNLKEPANSNLTIHRQTDIRTSRAAPSQLKTPWCLKMILHCQKQKQNRPQIQ